MVPLTLAAAFGVAKVNEYIFSDFRQRWKDQRILDAVRCSCEFSWVGHAKSHQAYLVGRFRALRIKTDENVEKCLTFQGEIPFAAPTQIITMMKKSWELRSHLKELNRELDAVSYRSQPLPLAQTSYLSSDERPRMQQNATGNATFLAQYIISWWLIHTSNFQSQAFENCIGHFKRSQLDDLNAQLGILFVRSVERVWEQILKRFEKIVVTMAWLQIGFFGSFSLSLGSLITHHWAKKHPMQIVARVFLISSRFFGFGSLVFSLTMGLAVGLYIQLMRKSKKHIKAINSIKDSMRLVIFQIRERRFQELVELGLRGVEQREKKLEKLRRKVAREAEKLAKEEQTHGVEELAYHSRRDDPNSH